MEEGSAEQTKLNAVLAFIGKPGEKNGVIIRFTDEVSFADASVGSDGTTVTIRVTETFHSLKGYRGDPTSNAAGVLAHEGLHGLEERNMGRNPVHKSEELPMERRAYDLQSKVHRALRHPSMHPSLWEPDPAFTEAFRMKAVEDYARRSTAAWCANRGADAGCP
jgi:hypothetical protein